MAKASDVNCPTCGCFPITINATRMSATEALYAFVGWLSTRERTISIGSDSDCAIWAELIAEFQKKYDLPEPRSGWETLILRDSMDVTRVQL